MSKRTVVGSGILLILFIILAILTTSGQLATLDETVSAAVHSWETPALTVVLLVITTAGEWFVYVSIILVLLAISKLRLKVGVPVAVTMAAVGTLNWALKQLFAVPRPDTHRLIAETGFSFPSGHAMSAAAFAGIVIFLFMRYSKKERHQTARKAGGVAAHWTARQTTQTTVVLGLGILFVLAVGFSRVYLGVHNPSDVMAGYAMGFFLSLLTVGVLDVLEARSKKNKRLDER